MTYSDPTGHSWWSSISNWVSNAISGGGSKSNAKNSSSKSSATTAKKSNITQAAKNTSSSQNKNLTTTQSVMYSKVKPGIVVALGSVFINTSKIGSGEVGKF